MTQAAAGTGGAVIAEAREVTVRFGDTVAVEAVDLAVHQAEVVAIIGPSGSGKSTFLRCFNHLQEPTSGSILIAGVETVGPGGRPRASELTQLRRKVGMCFQSFNLFPHLTAVENVMLAQVHALGRKPADASARSLELLDRVGLAHRANARPGKCSGGQQQRIAIARALALDPEIMLFDEPTSALDPELGVEVLTVVRELATSGMTMLVVTHEMHFAEDVADRLVFMADGRIVESGLPRDVLKEPQHDRTRKFLSAVIDR
jgi:polar amino acid transport system ATP-binding protein